MNDEFDPLCKKCGGTGDSGSWWTSFVGQRFYIECDCVTPASQQSATTVQQIIADRERAIRKQERAEKMAQKLKTQQLKTQQYLEEKSAEQALMRSNPNYGRF